MAKKAMRKYSFYIDDHTMSFVRWRAEDADISEADVIRRYIQEGTAKHIVDLFNMGRSQKVSCQKCGHKWVIDTMGSYKCPNCGEHDGDHHLINCEAD